MLLKSTKFRNLATIIFWLLCVGRVVDGSVKGSDGTNEVKKPESLGFSVGTTDAHSSMKGSVPHIIDNGEGGIAHEADSEAEDEEDEHFHRNIFNKQCLSISELEWHSFLLNNSIYLDSYETYHVLQNLAIYSIIYKVAKYGKH